MCPLIVIMVHLIGDNWHSRQSSKVRKLSKVKYSGKWNERQVAVIWMEKCYLFPEFTRFSCNADNEEIKLRNTACTRAFLRLNHRNSCVKEGKFWTHVESIFAPTDSVLLPPPPPLPSQFVFSAPVSPPPPPPIPPTASSRNTTELEIRYWSSTYGY